MQPVDQFVVLGDVASFQVIADGFNLTYQWQRAGVALSDSADDISGSTTALLTLFNVSMEDFGEYSCVLSNLVTSISTDVVLLRQCESVAYCSCTSLENKPASFMPYTVYDTLYEADPLPSHISPRYNLTLFPPPHLLILFPPSGVSSLFCCFSLVGPVHPFLFPLPAPFPQNIMCHLTVGE